MCGAGRTGFVRRYRNASESSVECPRRKSTFGNNSRGAEVHCNCELLSAGRPHALLLTGQTFQINPPDVFMLRPCFKSKLWCSQGWHRKPGDDALSVSRNFG